MHDYTAWQVHEHRITGFAREADASRLAAIAKEGQPRHGAQGRLRGWLSFALTHVSLEAWRSPSHHRRTP